MKYSAIILGAGLGSRFNSQLNKVWHSLNGQPILNWSITRFYSDPMCDQVIIVLSRVDQLHAASLHQQFPMIHTVLGGETREESVANAVSHITSDYCLIHDGARPFVSSDLITRVVDALSTQDAVIPAIDGDLPKHPDRELTRDGKKYRIQTPQGFKTSILVDAFTQCRRTQCFFNFRDDASLVEHFTNVKALIVDGDIKNIKITYPDDLRTPSK